MNISHYIEIYCDVAEDFGYAKTVIGSLNTSNHFCQFCGSTDHKEL